MDADCIEDRTAKVEKLQQGVAEFLADVQNNRAQIPNYGQRYRHDETICTSFVESTVNQVVKPFRFRTGLTFGCKKEPPAFPVSERLAGMFKVQADKPLEARENSFRGLREATFAMR